ncbi:TetR family transcriptional regulator [Acaricomes phytoseiuli]|uniref:TetR family transcriptional regulator n=1 Tax=Acaricomes phytoseiuli TaxID=291968 RepID=UPI0005B8682B|nr:TetR family transcriptional regulator [Acaricomes phytoseiuli]MCW1249619.1 TetR family transcriptional regulator [Acaricomes phytoseiuli]
MPPIHNRDAQATKHRLLEAAVAEFAHYGIAGARVDRIASEAESNKAQIYHYFKSKEGLFEAVIAEQLTEVVREVPIDADQLPEYAGRLFDGYQQHPDLARLAVWYRLERQPEAPIIQTVLESNQKKAAAIAEAQRRGAVSDSYPPEVLLGLILHLSSLWDLQTPEYLQMTSTLSTADRRDVVVSAVRALTEPAKS